MPTSELAGVNVLLAEDHDDVRVSTAKILSLYGANVITVANGAEGLAAIRIARPDVVVADLVMPEMDGYDFLREIRALGRGHGGEVPVIALSARTGDEEWARTREAGFALHLGKPAKASSLIKGILDVLENPESMLS